jgi:hypothetical protein
MAFDSTMTSTWYLDHLEHALHDLKFGLLPNDWRSAGPPLVYPRDMQLRRLFVAASALLLLASCKNAEKEYYACPGSGSDEGDQRTPRMMCHARICAKYPADRKFGQIACSEFSEDCDSARVRPSQPLMRAACKAECPKVQAVQSQLDKFYSDKVTTACTGEVTE